MPNLDLIAPHRQQQSMLLDGRDTLRDRRHAERAGGADVDLGARSGRSLPDGPIHAADHVHG